LLVLHLEAGSAGPGRIHLRLDDANGRLLADHDAAIDGSPWELEALGDLPARVAAAVDPTRRLAHEQELTTRIGHWTAEYLLGDVAAILAERAPATVTVSAAPEASWLHGLPLGIAVVGDEPLAMRRVVFVNEVAARDPADKEAMATACGYWQCSRSQRTRSPSTCGASATA
jgi:hypothetical protein